jgi:hypothetical protein
MCASDVGLSRASAQTSSNKLRDQFKLRVIECHDVPFAFCPTTAAYPYDPSNMASKQTTQNTVNELIAGSVGGAAQVLVGQPLDTVKTRAQIAPSVSRV